MALKSVLNSLKSQSVRGKGISSSFCSEQVNDDLIYWYIPGHILVVYIAPSLISLTYFFCYSRNFK